MSNTGSARYLAGYKAIVDEPIPNLRRLLRRAAKLRFPKQYGLGVNILMTETPILAIFRSLELGTC